MSIVHLAFATTRNPNFGSACFYLRGGDVFDVERYARIQNLGDATVDAQDLRFAEAALNKLDVGEWLEISCYEASDD